MESVYQNQSDKCSQAPLKYSTISVQQSYFNEVELSSFYTTFTYEDDDGLDWSNYIVAKTLEELDYSSYTNDAKYLYVQVGFGRGDTGIENEQILMEYRLAIVNTH